MDNTKAQDTIPQLSQEKILKIMNMVKNKELNIEEALDLAHAEKEAMNLVFPMDSQDWLTGSQFNFSVYKYKRYRWQKRILQIDFNTETIFNIEKGIIKKQFPFSQVKSCEDNEGRRFSITFHGRADYELEATSFEDKRKISHLMNKVTQGNSYRRPAESWAGGPAKCNVIHEGLLDLQQDSLASVKWVKYLVQLHEGELSLYGIGNNGENKNAEPVAKTINLSDGNVSVVKENGYDTFSVQTKECNYLFRIPFTVQNNRAGDVSKLQNEWVLLISRYCLLWKNRPEPQESFGEATSVAVYEKLTFSPNTQREGARCLPVASEAAVLSVSSALQSTPPTEQAAPDSSSLLLARVQAGMPPPPPSFPQPSHLSPASKRMKAFHWDVVPQEKIHKSIWASCSLHKKKIDESRIYDQFHIQDTTVFSGNETSVNRPIMLNQKIAHTFNIFLKSFHIKPNQLKEKLYILHEDGGGFTDEQITALRRYLPTPQDLEMYQSFKGSLSELHVVDQFMLEMCKIPHLGQRLDLLLTIRELPVCMGDLEPLINQKIRACKQLQASQKFVAVLEYILAIGNYLNENAGRKLAKGFRLSSLTKLSLLRGKEKKITLLHALVEQIFLHEPDLAKFSQELTEFEAVPGASIKGLRAEVDVLKKELENVIEYRKIIKSKTMKARTQESQFCKELKDLIQKYEGHLSQLSKRCDEMKKLYNETLVKFGELPDQDSQELFGWISAFIREFRKVSADMS
nr:formin-I-like isoform X1 [Pelodiscus sinensis]XP_025043699.1 formin-I-like isoform X1 [Pelodiscus sinensis]XP_025043700.1 formin-I-like isoform X1 [Pelodiscus sinensis]XP_025043701.1 formin-I-like isoform X1 [Pelodiscus sinensis]XP_025043702.1 formin-I-like isoform X1 [Pelodiscus sinensis]|eukprot:XP_006129464.1 formin-I-like isoform X1 [Pelodiscus sinensis]